MNVLDRPAVGSTSSPRSMAEIRPVSAFLQSSEEMLWLRLLPTKSKDDAGTKTEIVLNIGSRVGEPGAEIKSLYGADGKTPGKADI